jgi:hypothetical protein
LVLEEKEAVFVVVLLETDVQPREEWIEERYDKH